MEWKNGEYLAWLPITKGDYYQLSGIYFIFQKESGESFCPVDLEIHSQIGKFKASFPDDRVEKTQITKLIPYGEYPVYSTL